MAIRPILRYPDPGLRRLRRPRCILGNPRKKPRRASRESAGLRMAQRLRLERKHLFGEPVEMLVCNSTARRYTDPTIPRGDKRHDDPLLLMSLEGRCVYTIDWCFGGMKVAGVYGELPIGKEVAGQIVSHAGEEEENAIHFFAKVIRCDTDENITHLRFTLLSDSAFDAMERALVRRDTPVC
jgi:hypothetical protein